MHPRVVVLVTSLAVVPLSWPAAASPQLRPTPIVPERAAPTPGRAPAPTWDTFTADITIRRRVVKADGSTRFQGPEMRYRWTRRLEDAGWKTTLSVMPAAAATVHGLSGPRVVTPAAPVSRVEVGDPRTPMRVYDGAGRLTFQQPTRPLVEGPPETDLGAASAAAALPIAPYDVLERADADSRSREWIEQFLPRADDVGPRQARLARRLGSRAGNVRGLDRFVSSDDGEGTTEVLLDPTWAVPVEVNVVRSGRLVSHSVVSYQHAPGAGLVRRRVRSEQLLSAESGDRAVAEVDFENIRLDRGAGR
jgi:hypothetical protein